MMKYIEYHDHEIAPGMTILHQGRALKVEQVIFHYGQGLVLYTQCEDGYGGPSITTHPDEMVKVIHGTPPALDPGHQYSDYPYAEVQRF